MRAPRAAPDAYIYCNSPCHCSISQRRELIQGKNHQAAEKFHREGTGNKQLPQSTVWVKLNWQEPLNPTLLPNTAKPFRVTEGDMPLAGGCPYPEHPGRHLLHPTPHTANLQPAETGREVRSYLTPLESLTRLFSLPACTQP